MRKRFFASYWSIPLAFIVVFGLFWIMAHWFFAPDYQIPNRRMCQVNMKQIALALMMYSQDHDEKFPPIIFSDKTVGWANSLQPYMETAQFFQCPSEKHERQDSPYLPGFTDYWMNQNVASVKREKLDNIVAIILLGDGDGGSPASTASYAIGHLPASWLQSSDSPAERHLGGANYAFADGHVKWLKPEQITQEMPAKNKDIYTFRLK